MFEGFDEAKRKEWLEMSEWINLFIATYDERISEGTVRLHFLHWYTVQQCFGEYSEYPFSRDERHKIIDFVFKKVGNGKNDLNQDILEIGKVVPSRYNFATPRSTFMEGLFWNKYRHTKEYAHLFWDYEFSRKVDL